MVAEMLPFDEFRVQICRICRESLPLDRFSIWTEKRRGTTQSYRRRACKGCLTKCAQRWTDENPERALDTRLRREFGITLEQYNARLAEQGGVCAICKEPPTFENSGRWRKRRKIGETEWRLVVDHDHVTREVRGLLCGRCNTGIGFLKDDAAVVESALLYLRGGDQDR